MTLFPPTIPSRTFTTSAGKAREGPGGAHWPLRLMSASQTPAAVPTARKPPIGSARGMHASFKDFSKKCYTAAHADTHKIVGEALRKGVGQEENENLHSVGGIYNSLGR